MQKSTTMYKSVIQGIENYFHFDNICSTEIAKMACLDCLKWIGQLEDQAKAQEQAKAATAQPEAPKVLDGDKQ